MPTALLLGSLLLAGRTPGMAALGLTFNPQTPLPSATFSRLLGPNAHARLLSFAALYTLAPELVMQLRRALIMRGFSMPTASLSQQRTWTIVRWLERAAAASRLANLVRLLRMHHCQQCASSLPLD